MAVHQAQKACAVSAAQVGGVLSSWGHGIQPTTVPGIMQID
jgi:hypothetical protein